MIGNLFDRHARTFLVGSKRDLAAEVLKQLSWIGFKLFNVYVEALMSEPSKISKPLSPMSTLPDGRCKVDSGFESNEKVDVDSTG